MPSASSGGTIVSSDQIAPGVIVNSDIAATAAIAISKLAGGTDGELITWDAAGVIDTVGAGAAGQVLTSGGAGVAPTMQAGAGWRLLSAQQGSTTGTSETEILTFTLSANDAKSGDRIVVWTEVTGSHASNLVNNFLRVTDGTGTRDTGNDAWGGADVTRNYVYNLAQGKTTNTVLKMTEAVRRTDSLEQWEAAAHTTGMEANFIAGSNLTISVRGFTATSGTTLVSMFIWVIPA